MQTKAPYSLIVDKQDSSQVDHDWLSKQFNKTPFRLYKYWLILSLITSLVLDSQMIHRSLEAYEDFLKATGDDYDRMHPSSCVIFLFCLLGCGEMLYAIYRKKAKIAQKSLLKFQFALIGSVLCSLVMVIRNGMPGLTIDWALFGFMVLSPIVHLIGGFGVLQVFRKNHPLVRRIYNEESEESDKDFLEQNQVIAGEMSKYDEQLNTWPYFIYKCWLKIEVVLEISLVFSFIAFELVDIVGNRMRGISEEPFLFVILVGHLVLSFLKAYSCVELEVVTRKRDWEKSKKAIFLLKIWIGLSIIMHFVGRQLPVGEKFYNSGKFSSSLFWLSCFFLAPLLTLAGASKVNQVLEQREQFVKVSSYTGDTYL